MQFTHLPDENSGLKNKYVTEQNKSEIKDGYIISLVSSINYMLEWIFVSIDNTFEDAHKKMILLPNLCDDPGVLKEMGKLWCKTVKHIPTFGYDSKSIH